MGEKLPKKAYEDELNRLQAELVKMQNWARASGARIVVIFEGRDAAGKGGTIRRVTEYLNPRFARIAALDKPTERESGQWYFQRYIAQLPTAGEIVLFDRSWYNRAGVEHVMGFCTPDEYHRFMHQCPTVRADAGRGRHPAAQVLVLGQRLPCSRSGSSRGSTTRCAAGSCRRWTPESINRWEDYSRAKDEMFMITDIPEAPWYVVESDDKRRARINMIAHLLSTVPYHDVPEPKLKLPRRPDSTGYVRTDKDMQTFVPDHAGSLLSPALRVVRQTGAREQR